MIFFFNYVVNSFNLVVFVVLTKLNFKMTILKKSD